ncbi:MAG: FkbM family methyltransferase [Hungatella sp.]|nr:FkbM family methyltransferase [Hungatella sp.]
MEKFYQIVEDIRTQSDLIKFRLMYEENKIFVIFGAGDCGHCIYNMLHNTSINVAYFCDNKMGGLIDEITGLKIISPKDLNTNMSELVLLICTIDVNAITSIYKQLLTQGFEKAQIFNMREYFFRVPLSYLEDHIEEYKKAYRMLQEETSKQVYLARMKRSFIIGDLSEVISPHEKEYFDEMIKLTQEEVFIDCGGFDGDTSIKFLEMCQGRYKDIVIFEPEACKKNAIEKNLMEYRYELYQMGVWSKSTILNFYALGTDSSFVTDKESDYMIDVVSLDEAIYDKRPTFIKMDIEGSEQEAIKGCQNILKDYKPKLAVCLYHKPDDLFNIPLLIKKINPTYQLYIRQYGNSRTGTILYAI